MIDSEQRMEVVLQSCRKATGNPSIDHNSEFQRTLGWDSVAQVKLMMALEGRLNVEIPAELFGELTSIAKIVRWLEELG